MLHRLTSVPGQKGNLICSGTLDTRGYKYSSQGEALKISRGAMVVPKKKMYEHLYKLIGRCIYERMQGEL